MANNISTLYEKEDSAFALHYANKQHSNHNYPPYPPLVFSDRSSSIPQSESSLLRKSVSSSKRASGEQNGTERKKIKSDVQDHGDSESSSSLSGANLKRHVCDFEGMKMRLIYYIFFFFVFFFLLFFSLLFFFFFF